MKSLFRAIRRKLLEEGKLLRYLTYAIGEVVLIIVGILFALKINDWNEDRKAQVEFDAYVVQLKEDVRTAIVETKSVAERNESRAEGMDKIPIFLGLNEHDETSLSALEIAISSLGSYDEPQVFVGLLGELLNGNKEVVSRNRVITLAALKMETAVKRRLSNLDHIYNQIDLDASVINQYRGKGAGFLDRRPTYNLEKIRSSEEFMFSARTIASRMMVAASFSNAISEYLEDFLVALEEYE